MWLLIYNVLGIKGIPAASNSIRRRGTFTDLEPLTRRMQHPNAMLLNRGQLSEDILNSMILLMSYRLNQICHCAVTMWRS
jgi:hypothetical protein